MRQALTLAGLPAEREPPVEFDLGQGALRVEPFLWPDAPAEAGELDGLNLSFPLGLPDAQGDRAVAAALAAAHELGAQVFDPQLGRLVGKLEHEEILRNWRRSYDFQLGVVGALELGPGAPSPARPETSGLATKTKIILSVAGAILLLSFMLRSCFDRWMERQLNAPEPGQLEPMEAPPEPGAP